MYTKWIGLLTDVELFKNIGKEELTSMLMCICPNVVSYKKKESITMSENDFDGIGIVVEGEVIVTKENAAGNRVIMAKLKEGDLFGEIIAFSGYNKWAATVIANTDCTILFLPPEKILGNCPKMCPGHKLLIQNMLKIVSRKALGLNRKVEYLSIKSIRGKIATYLLEQYNKYGEQTFMVPLKRSELAEFLNVSRPSLSREICNMRDEGIIDFYKSSFKILDIKALQKNI
ncbi:Crp/Fnr family transcriptional regulator [Maledivibacter halophilus]|uniref:cAMP-binding domain of CRP or a regulatory subunit of cAMP-dependent protein kinases n=1 Tax=Maledivibacter halophilus TaxID=36842 RepID=A0A1T5LTR8_9FIRM|nr:Crp/Fnr family transcriptional regulator [Maledivibacter halophilus]SKC79294.1 cAMP-binding domain of CRP or a regulatory subunit of cAMP-dependent protein kinases [Maledivibacter halophilus]